MVKPGSFFYVYLQCIYIFTLQELKIGDMGLTQKEDILSDRVL